MHRQLIKWRELSVDRLVELHAKFCSAAAEEYLHHALAAARVSSGTGHGSVMLVFEPRIILWPAGV